MPDPLETPHPPPNALSYQAPGQGPPLPPLSAAQTLRLFFAGLTLGTALSAIVWIIAFRFEIGMFAGGAMVVIPLLKLSTGIIFVCRRGWRSLGAGILVSLALGFLIFFGVCAAHLGGIH
ncbi:MAG TPA: hypothetical protein VG326_01095 [Tepidisphaeraceae bacterium]|jgi:hypothetical protein|nr:hypothetical protein [Tepidisphaeraceae bacterium]